MDRVEEIVLVDVYVVMEETYFGIYKLVYNTCTHVNIFDAGSCVRHLRFGVLLYYSPVESSESLLLGVPLSFPQRAPSDVLVHAPVDLDDDW